MSATIQKLKTAIENAGAILVGAGSGFSTAAGYTYSGERFHRHFADFIGKYHFGDMYSAGFYPFPTPEEKWAYWSRHIYYNRYDQPKSQVHKALLELLQGNATQLLLGRTAAYVVLAFICDGHIAWFNDYLDNIFAFALQ